jgi:hypothetical protein
MTAFANPKLKLTVAALLCCLVPAVAAMAQLGPATGARLALGLMAVGGMGWWAWQAKRTTKRGFSLPPRLAVVQRVGLDARTSMALVEVDGQPFIVVHGQGFAQLQPAPRNGPVVISPLVGEAQ